MYTDKLKKCIEIGEERQKQYGDVKTGFYSASSLAEQMFGILITPEEIALVMVALKVSRNKHAKKKDNTFDMINYLAIADELSDEQNGTKGHKRLS